MTQQEKLVLMNTRYILKSFLVFDLRQTVEPTENHILKEQFCQRFDHLTFVRPYMYFKKFK